MRFESEERQPPLRNVLPATGRTDTCTDAPSRSFAACLAGLIAVMLLAATFQIGIDKDLDKTVTPHEWGRYKFAISAAITELKFDIGRFAASEHIENALQAGGLTGVPDFLKALGRTFPDNLKDPELLQSALDRAWNVPNVSPDKPEADGHYPALRGALGDDVGLSTYTVLSFVLFGRTIPALYYLYFAIIGAAIVLYAIAHGRDPAAMTFLAVGVMALCVVVSSDLINFDRTLVGRAGAFGLDIKDPRFLSTLALVPVLHIVASWLRPRPLGFVTLVTLVGQVLILAFALHVRASVQWMVISLVGLCVLGILLAWRPRGKVAGLVLRQRRTFSFVALGMMIVIILAGHVLTMLVAHPLYALEGDRITHPFWRGVYYSLQLNPRWAEKYAATVDGAVGDDLPVVAVKKEIAKLPPDEQPKYLSRYGDPTMVALEKFSRQLFFDLLRRDPQFMFETFFASRYALLTEHMDGFYKSLRQTTGTWQGAALGMALLLLVALACFAGHTVAGLALFTAVAGLFSILALVPNWLISVEETLMTDHFVWGLMFFFAALVFVGVALCSLVRLAARAIRPEDGTTSNAHRSPRSESPRHRRWSGDATSPFEGAGLIPDDRWMRSGWRRRSARQEFQAKY